MLNAQQLKLKNMYSLGYVDFLEQKNGIITSGREMVHKYIKLCKINRILFTYPKRWSRKIIHENGRIIKMSYL